MNFNTVVSAIAATDLSGLENLAVTLTAEGVQVANAADRAIGIIVRGCGPGEAAGIFLTAANGLSYVGVADNNAINIGDELERVDAGIYQKKFARAITGASATGIFTSEEHELPAGVKVSLSGLTGGSDLNPLPTIYYTLPIDANTFKLSLTKGGAPVALGSDVTAGTLTRSDWEAAPAGSQGGFIRALLF